VKKDNINVRIDGNIIQIEAEVKKHEETKDNGGRVIGRERWDGTLSPTFSEAQDVDESTASAFDIVSFPHCRDRTCVFATASASHRVKTPSVQHHLESDMGNSGRVTSQFVVAGALVCLSSTVIAQSAGSVAGGTESAIPAARPAASEPAQVAKKTGSRSAAWWGASVTPGWSLMTWAERNEHRKMMRSMKTYDACKTYIDKHHEEMATRAKEKGKEGQALARRDACERLKP
jgi:hypothetical protein